MAYRSAKRMTLSGVEYGPGDRIPQETLAGLPYGRLDSLRRVGHIVEIVDSPVAVEPIETPKPKARKKAKSSAMKTEKVEEVASEESPLGDEPVVSSDPEAST